MSLGFWRGSGAGQRPHANTSFASPNPKYTQAHFSPLWEHKSLLLPCLFVLKAAYDDLLNFMKYLKKPRPRTQWKHGAHSGQHSSSLFIVNTSFAICLPTPAQMRLDFGTIPTSTDFPWLCTCIRMCENSVAWWFGVRQRIHRHALWWCKHLRFSSCLLGEITTNPSRAADPESTPRQIDICPFGEWVNVSNILLLP